jgi:hypothetical protein
MTHKNHEEFSEEVFRNICEDALQCLPDIAKNSTLQRPIRERAALEHLLALVKQFCGIEHGFSFEDVSKLPRNIQIKQEIIGVVDFDSLHEHPTSSFFRKEPVIDDYLGKVFRDDIQPK